MQPEQSGENEFGYQKQAVDTQKQSTDPQSASVPKSKKPSTDTITWQASEFIENQKSPTWFLLLGVATVVVCVVTYLLSKSIFSVLVVGLAGLAFGVVAKQKPRNLTYALSPNVIKIGEKDYSYDDFRTFSVAQEGAIPSIVLNPIKRLMPSLTIYFAPEDGEKIFDIIASHIPHEEYKVDSVDRLMKKIRY